MMTPAQFLAHVESFLTEAHITPSRFGMTVVGDPNFVFDLRNGRVPGLAIAQRVLDHIDVERAKLKRPRGRRKPERDGAAA